jgi:hypothetical protein
MPHPLHAQLLSALKTLASKDEPYVYLCNSDPYQWDTVEMSYSHEGKQTKTLRLKLFCTSGKPLEPLEKMKFKIIKEELVDRFTKKTRLLVRAEMTLKDLEKAADLAFAVMSEYFGHPPDHVLYVTSESNRDEWENNKPPDHPDNLKRK